MLMGDIIALRVHKYVNATQKCHRVCKVEMSPNALREAKPDRAETSAIAALAGFAVCDALLVCKAVPASVPAPVLFVIVLCANGFDLRRRRGLLLFFLDVGQHSAEMFVLGDCCVGDPLLMWVEDAAG